MLNCPNDRSINVTYLEAPLEKVWWSVVTPDGSNTYLTNQVMTTGDRERPASGDEYMLYYGDITNRATVMCCEEYRKFTLADQYESMAPDGTVDPFHVTTTYSFERIAGFTRLTLEVHGYADTTHDQWFRECLEMGWRRSLMNLKCVLELGMDLRTELFSFPRLGVTNCTVNAMQSEETGVPIGEGNYLLHVFPESPADHAGLCTGDVITAIDDVKISNYDSFVRQISTYYGAKTPIRLTYIREKIKDETTADLSIDRMFTGLIEGTDSAQETERKRRQMIANQRSASGELWNTPLRKDDEQ